MKNVFLIFLFLILAHGAKAQGQEEDRARENITAMFQAVAMVELQDYLTKEGYEVLVRANDCKVEFHKGKEYYTIWIDEANPMFFYLEDPGYSLSGYSRNELLQLANAVNSYRDLVKAYVDSDDSVAFRIDMYCTTYEEYIKILPILIGELEAISTEFADMISGEDL